jgi:putative permease
MLVLMGLTAIFFVTPSLRPVSFLTVLNVLFLRPVVHYLIRRKVPKLVAILSIYVVLALLFFFGINKLVHALAEQWNGLVASLPTLGDAAIQKLNQLEEKIRDWTGLEVNLGIHDRLVHFASDLKNWAINHIPSLLGSLASAALLVPIFSFFIMKDGETYMSLLWNLVPTRFSSSSKNVLHKISVALGRFLRAKLIEAFIFGLMMYVGLKIIHSPYAGIFSVIGGVTNLIPYLGPIIGAAPPLLIFGFSESLNPLFWPLVLIVGIANLVDNLFIFPVFVAKIVNLSPLTLLVSVAVGQELYGVAGMLLALPAASILKIIFIEVQELLYPSL